MSWKKVLSLVLALAMMFSLATPVHALESAADDLDNEEPAVVETVDDVTEEEPAETPEEIPTDPPAEIPTDPPEEIPTDPPADDLGEVTDPDPSPADDPADEVEEEDDLSIMSEEAEEEEEIEIQGDDDTVYVAQIGEVKYESLAEAFTAAQASDRIVVLKDCEIEGITVNKAVTLDLAGFEVSSRIPELFLVEAAGDLTITGNGRITGPQHGEDFDSKTLITVDAGKLTIEDGTLTATGAGSNGMYGVYALNGGTAIFGKAGGSGPVITSYFAAIGKNHMTGPATITIYGGTYTANAEPTGNEWWSYFCAPIYAAASGTITIMGGTFNGYYGISDRYADVEQTLTINGGTFNASSAIDVFVREVSGSGGTANRTIRATFDTLRVPEGYKWAADGEGVYKLVMNEYTAADVDAMIDAIEEPVTLESAGAIMNARDAYEGLTEAEKNQVQNLEKLERVEAELKSLQAESALAEGIKLNHEYVILNEGDKLQLSVLNLEEIGNVPIEWSVENDNNKDWAYDKDLIDVDKVTGLVEALSPFELDGKLITTAFVRATALGKDGVSHYARCRVDVVAEDLGEDLNSYGVRLIDTKVKVPLLSTDYVGVRIQLAMLQDIETMADGDESELKGDAAIESAFFANHEASQVFDLRVKDDRTLEIIPKSNLVTTDATVLKTVKGSYKSAITVMVEDKPYTTNQLLTLSVDKKLPKVTVKAVKLNSFYDDMQKLVITGGTAESVTAVGAPGWMKLDKNEMAIRFNLGENNVNQKLKASTKLTLQVKLKGWAIANDVKISVSAAPTVPKLKFTPATLTVNPLTGDTASAGWIITPAAFAEDEVLISKIMKGKDTQVNPDNEDPSSFAAYGLSCEIDDGRLTVTTGEGFDSSKAWTFKVYLSVDGVEYPVTVKTLKAATPVTMAVKAAGSINLDIPLSPVKLTATIKNFNKGAAEYDITQIVAAGTTEDVQGKFNIELDGNVFTITADAEDLQAGAYEATVKATDADGELVATQTVKFNVTRPTKPVTPTVTVKAKGNIDVLRAASTSVVLTPTFKNCYIHEFAGGEVLTKAKANVTDKFDIEEQDDGTVTVAIKDGEKVSHAEKYTVSVKYKINDTETVIASKPVTLSVKQGKAAVSISSKAVKLFKNDRFSTGEVTIRITDPTLTGIKPDPDGVKFVSPKVKGVEIFELRELGNGVYAIAFKDNTPPNPNWKYKGGTAKIQVFLEGNETTKANVTFSVKVNVG